VNSPFFKFPSTPHLAVLEGVVVRTDKVLSDRERQEFLSHEIVIEEKIDGANLGISFDCYGNVQAQNRGAVLHMPAMGQWKPLADWISRKCECMFESLVDRYILFGEWCYATHSVFYDELPDWFLGFDLYDSTSQRFVNTPTRRKMFSRMGVHSVPTIAAGHFTLSQATALLKESHFGIAPAEGLYLRYDEGEWLAQRAKLLRPGFIQSIDQHWSRKNLRLNRLANEGVADPQQCEAS
jgi:RNA ligase